MAALCLVTTAAASGSVHLVGALDTTFEPPSIKVTFPPPSSPVRVIVSGVIEEV